MYVFCWTIGAFGGSTSTGALSTSTSGSELAFVTVSSNGALSIDSSVILNVYVVICGFIFIRILKILTTL